MYLETNKSRNTEKINIFIIDENSIIKHKEVAYTFNKFF